MLHASAVHDCANQDKSMRGQVKSMTGGTVRTGKVIFGGKCTAFSAWRIPRPCVCVVLRCGRFHGKTFHSLGKELARAASTHMSRHSLQRSGQSLWRHRSRMTPLLSAQAAAKASMQISQSCSPTPWGQMVGSGTLPRMHSLPEEPQALCKMTVAM